MFVRSKTTLMAGSAKSDLTVVHYRTLRRSGKPCACMISLANIPTARRSILAANVCCILHVARLPDLGHPWAVELAGLGSFSSFRRAALPPLATSLTLRLKKSENSLWGLMGFVNLFGWFGGSSPFRPPTFNLLPTPDTSLTARG